jgi:hypothetical protein
MLPEPVILQGGCLQKGEDLHLALGCRVHDVAKNNFRTLQGRDQESLLVKQSKGKVEREYTTQTWVWTHQKTGATSALTSEVFMAKRKSVLGV